MTIHYNFYESLDIDRDSSTGEIREELSGRLDSLRREGTPEYDPKVQEVSTALNVLGDDDKRALHDERLDDPLAPRMGIAELRTLATTGSFPGGHSAPSAPGASAGVRPAAYPTPPQASSDDAPTVVGTPGAAGTPVSTHETEADDDSDDTDGSDGHGIDVDGASGSADSDGPGTGPGIGAGATAAGAAGLGAAASPSFGSGPGAGAAEPSPAYYAPAGQQSGPHSDPQPAYPAPQGNAPYGAGAPMQPGQQQGQQQPQFPNVPPKPKAPKAPENPDNPSLAGLVTGAPTVVKVLGGILAANTVISALAMLIAFFNVSSEDWNTVFGYMGDVIAIGASAAVVPFLGVALTSAFLLPRVLKGRDNGLIIPLVATGAIFTMFAIALAVTYGGTMTKLLMILLAITHIAMIVLAFIPDTRAWFNGTWQPAPAAPAFAQQGGYPQPGQTGQQPQTQQAPQQYGAPQGQTGQHPQYGQPQQGQAGQQGQQYGTQQPGQ